MIYKKPGKTPLMLNRTGYIIRPNVSISFLYQKQARTDILPEGFLKNIDMQSVNIIIKTDSKYPFTVSDQISIENHLYKIERIYKEEEEGSEFLRRKPTLYTYLNLKG